jgi:hypothetical protein
MYLTTYGERDYVGSFLAIKSNYFLEFERRADGLGEGTADIIRLIRKVTFHSSHFTWKITPIPGFLLYTNNHTLTV